MLRKLMILVCLVMATTVFAQQPPVSKTTEKQDEPKIDYQEMGAPLPPLKLLVFHDTSSKKNMPDATAVKNDRKKFTAGKLRKMDDTKRTYLTEADVNNNANLLVMIFNPSCSHCEDETAIIQNNISLFSKSQLVMVSKPINAAPLNDFYQRRKIGDFQPPIHIGTDSSDFIGKTFVFGMLPQINIYDHHRKLIKTFNGEIAIDSLKKYIE